ncbi:MAG: CBS domain-containing protein [Candidatus Aenigmatarchaeota archaeon]
MALVKDIMSKPVVTIDMEKSIKDAAKLMKKNRIGCLIVVKKGKAVGMLTDSDIIKKVVAEGKLPSKVKVKNVMGRPLIKISPEGKLEEAVEKMEKNKVKRLCVVDEKGKPVGLISLTDIAKSSSKMYEMLREKIEERGEEIVIKEQTTIGICDYCENYSDLLRQYDDKWLCPNCMDEALQE